ncbi:MAG: hypothetical protein JWQ97_971 [Phenylobacterium sp.]|nr:hypothetical protein [Phenylobacterium sp.]
MLKDVLARIEQRLAALKLKPATASRKAGLSEDAIRNMQRAVEKDASQGVSTNTIFALAPVLETTPAWLLDGTGQEETRLVPIIGRVGADSSGEVIQVDAHGGYDTAPIPPGGSARAVALEVIGDSMPWLAPAGALVYFEDQRTPPTEDMVYYYVIAELDDGRVLLKRLLRGSEPGLWTLESQMGPPIENVRIHWAAEPTAIVPPRQARIIIKRAGESQVA